MDGFIRYHPPPYPCPAHKIRSLTRTYSFRLRLLTLHGTSNTAHPVFVFQCPLHLLLLYAKPFPGNEELPCIQLPQDFLVYRCLKILKPDSFFDFPQAVYSSAQTNNTTVHSPTTNKMDGRTDVRARARTHTHTHTQEQRITSRTGFIILSVSESADVW